MNMQLSVQECKSVVVRNRQDKAGPADLKCLGAALSSDAN